MEALKRAEEAKRQNSEGQVAGTHSELTLEPVVPASPGNPPGSPLPDLALHIDSLDADLAAVSTEAPARRRAPPNAPRPAAESAQATERQTARNAFAAKHPPSSKGVWIAAAGGAAAALVIGGYFWWQLQSVSGNSLAPQAQPAPALPRPAPAAQSAPLAPMPTLAATQDTPPELPSALRERAAAPSLAERPAAARKPAAASADTPPGGPFRLSRTAPRSSPPLEQAYDALQAGRMDEAQRAYEQVLRGDPKNTDALLGLATIASRQSNFERAQAYYLQALESDPNDPTAQAGIINTRGQADPGLSESRLKTALAAQPDSSALLFALGNLYARQQRWSEAQQAYFRAYSSEPDNADFIFNLAVSLDQLRQAKLAAQYYRMALNTSETHTPARAVSFDKAQVRNRILELQP